jgi:hypothetical protein
MLRLACLPLILVLLLAGAIAGSLAVLVRFLVALPPASG